jgi:hypothetical protein
MIWNRIPDGMAETVKQEEGETYDRSSESGKSGSRPDSSSDVHDHCD